MQWPLSDAAMLRCADKVASDLAIYSYSDKVPVTSLQMQMMAGRFRDAKARCRRPETRTAEAMKELQQVRELLQKQLDMLRTYYNELAADINTFSITGRQPHRKGVLKSAFNFLFTL